jgi:amicoumacin kinase
MEFMSTKLDEQLVREACSRFAKANTRFTPLDGFESGVFAWTEAGHRFVMKLTSDKHRSEAHILAELDFVHYASERGFPTPRAVPSKNGLYLEQVSSPSEDLYWAYAFEWAEGDKLTEDEWGPELFKRWGKTMGELHQISNDYHPSNPKGERPHWSQENQFLEGLEVISGDTEVLAAINARLERLRRIPEEQGQFGLIHNDLHPHNFHLYKDQLIVFDFDGLVHHHFANEIAVASYYAMYWSYSRPNREKDRSLFLERFLDSLLEGYQLYRTTPKELLQSLPDWMMLRHLLLYTAHLHRWGRENLSTKQRWTLNRYRTDLVRGTLFGGVTL